MPSVNPIRIATIADLKANEHRLNLHCQPCNRWHQLDLDEFIKAGRGDLNYVSARFRCKKCGGAAEKQIRPPKMVEPVITRHTQKTQCD